MLVYIQLFDIGLLRVSLDVLIFIDLFSLEKQGKNIHLVLKPEIFIVSPQKNVNAGALDSLRHRNMANI